MEPGGEREFDGTTVMQGGEFATVDDSMANGFVAFNCTTTWNGKITPSGASQQNGSATVTNALGAVINARAFDMDGGAGNSN